MFIELFNIIATYYYMTNILPNITISPFLYKGNLVLRLSKNKYILIYPWMLYIIYMYRYYIAYIVRKILRNIFIISIIRYIYNIKKNLKIHDNIFLEI